MVIVDVQKRRASRLARKRGGKSLTSVCSLPVPVCDTGGTDRSIENNREAERTHRRRFLNFDIDLKKTDIRLTHTNTLITPTTSPQPAIMTPSVRLV
jgi:hypothetical protein